MELFETIYRRQSFRRAFMRGDLPESDLIKIVSAGIQAPAAFNIQTTEFVIVNQPELLRQLADAIPKKNIRTAPAAIVCLGREIPNPYGISFMLQNLSVAVENMLLAVVALGYASVWMDDPLLNPEVADRITRMCNIPPDRRVLVLLPVGRPMEAVEKTVRPGFNSLAAFNDFRQIVGVNPETEKGELSL